MLPEFLKSFYEIELEFLESSSSFTKDGSWFTSTNTEKYIPDKKLPFYFWIVSKIRQVNPVNYLDD